MTAKFTGYDIYENNNVEEFEVTVLSNQWIAVAGVVVALIAVVAVLAAIRHTMYDIKLKQKRYVKNKTRFLKESIWNAKNKEEIGFVKKKK